MIKRNNHVEQPIHTFTTNSSAKSFLDAWVRDHELCEKLSGLYTSNSSCFNYTIEKCGGACISEENIEDYNQKVNSLIDKLTFNRKSFLILDKGKIKSESSFVYIENGEYIGYGFAPSFILKKKHQKL